MIHYLIQGRHHEIGYINEVFKGKIYSVLTWDKEHPGCIYFPNSSWSQGRRRLFEEVNSDIINYIAYVDADFKIIRGSLAAFESKIEKFKPALAVPVVDKNTKRYVKYLKFGQALIFSSDEQFHVFHKDILRNYFLNNPYVSKFDKVSWWYPCVITQAFINRRLWRSTLVDLDFEISNAHEAKYPNDFDPEFISKKLRDYGINWYFPLLANGKSKNLRFFFRIADRIALLVTIVFFKIFYKSHEHLKPSERVKREAVRIFHEI